MILVLLLLFVDDIPLDGIVVPLITLPGILLRPVIFNRFYWLGITALFVFFYQYLGLQHYLPNHHYIFSYILIATTVALFAKHYDEDWKSLFSKMARLIIGFCFLFATIGKFLAPEFLNGSFFEFTCLTDERFHGMTSVVGGVDTAVLYNGYLDFMSLLHTTNPATSITLQSVGILKPLSYFLSYWTIFIEGMIGITFLSPAGSKLHRIREVFLIAFIITTYPIATVPGFATTLALLAYLQTHKAGRLNYLSYFYILLFLAIPLFKVPFLRILNMI
jgi:hypothetical protein